VGILKTAATAAVASSVHGRVQRRQQARWAARDQQAEARPEPPPPPPRHEPPPPPRPEPAPAAAGPDEMAERLSNLTKLGELLQAGVLTQAEFEQQKARILNG